MPGAGEGFLLLPSQKAAKKITILADPTIPTAALRGFGEHIMGKLNPRGTHEGGKLNPRGPPPNHVSPNPLTTKL